MDDFDVKTCVICNTEKCVGHFCIKYREIEQCIIRRVLKRYYNNKDVILQKSRQKYACFEGFDTRINTLGEKRSIFTLIT